MDVRCEKCGTVYEFEDARVTTSGVTVKCTHCGNLFRVRRRTAPFAVVAAPADRTQPGQPIAEPPRRHTARLATIEPRKTPSVVPAVSPPRTLPGVAAAVATPQPPDERVWQLRLAASGEVRRFRELTTLQQWIAEQRVGREDQISRTGENWKRLGDIAELASFFLAVSQSSPSTSGPPFIEDLALATTAPQEAPALPVPVASGSNGSSHSRRLPAITPSSAGSEPPLIEPDRPDAPRRSIFSLWLIVVPLVALGGGAGYLAFKREAVNALFGRVSVADLSVLPDLESGDTATQPPEDAAAIDLAPGPAAMPDASLAGASTDKRAPRGFDELIAFGNRALESGKTHAAQRAFEQALAERPGSLEAMVGIGYCQLDSERFGAAIDRFQEVLKMAPNHGDAVIGLAEAYKARGDAEKAIEHYRKAIVLLPPGSKLEMAERNVRELEAAAATKSRPTPAAKEEAPAPESKPEEAAPAPAKEPERRPVPQHDDDERPPPPTEPPP